MKQQGFTLKSVVIGLILVLINAYWVAVGSELWNTLQVTIASLFFNAVFTFSFCFFVELKKQNTDYLFYPC